MPPVQTKTLQELRAVVERHRNDKARIEAELIRVTQTLQQAEEQLAAAEFQHGMQDDALVQKAGEDMKKADRDFRKTLLPPKDWSSSSNSDIPYNCTDDFADFRLLEESVERQLTVFQSLVDDLAAEEPPADGSALSPKAVSAVRLLACISGQIAEWLTQSSDGINDDSFSSPPDPDASPKLKFEESVPCVEHYGGLDGSASLLEQKDELIELWCSLATTDSECDEVPVASRRHLAPVIEQFGDGVVAVIRSAVGGSEFFAGQLEKLAEAAGRRIPPKP